MKPVLSVVTSCYNRRHDVGELYSNLSKQAMRSKVEFILVDNGSSDGTKSFVEGKFPFVTVVRLEKNIGLHAALNSGIRRAKAPLLAVFDSDVVVRDKRLLAKVASRLLNEKEFDIIAMSVRTTAKDDFGQENPRHSPVKNRGGWAECFAFNGNGFALKKRVFENTGGFDEDFFIYYGEADFCIRSQDRGYRTAYFDDLAVYHKQSGSARKIGSREFYASRNVFWFYYKNLPIWAIAGHLFGVGAFLRFFTSSTHKLQAVRGLLAAIAGLPRMLAKRKPVSNEAAKKFFEYG